MDTGSSRRVCGALTIGWLLLFAATALPGEGDQAAEKGAKPVLLVDARDARDGRNLTGLICALVQPPDEDAYAQFEGSSYTGPRRPRSGDVLLVYRRGYDLGRVVLTGKERGVAVRLAPARHSGVFVIEGEGADALMARRGLKLQILLKSTRRRRPGAVRDSYVLRPEGKRITLTWGEGMHLVPLAEADEGILWPLMRGPDPGEEVVLHYDRGRLVSVVRDPARPAAAPFVECFPDLLWTPPVSPEQVNAWRWHLNGPGWLRKSFAQGDPQLRLVPDVPFHLFLLSDGEWIYRHAPAGAEKLDLRNPFALRPISVRPRLDGKPIRSGTILAPGRLDLYTVSAVAERGRMAAGLTFEVPTDREWPEISLPTAAWLTAWHPEEGLAHLAWKPDGTAEGSAYRGLVVVSAPTGWSGSGYVSLYPVWKGAGGLQTTPPDKDLRRALEGGRSVGFRGVAPGRYAVDIRVRLIHAKSGVEREVGRVAEFDVTEKRPVVDVSMFR